jgi:small-conductance mechanosensitive channel
MQGSVLERLLLPEGVESAWTAILVWIESHLLTIDVAIQFGLIVAALVPAALFGPRIARMAEQRLSAHLSPGPLRRAAQALSVLALPIALYLTLTIIRIALGSADRPTQWVGGAIALMNAWIIVRLITLVIQSAFWSRLAFYIAWPIAALDAFGALGPVVQQMHQLALPVGTNAAGQPVSISLFDVVRTLFYFLLLLWGSTLVGRLLEQRIAHVDELSPSLRALLVKLLHVVLPIVALLIAFHLVGFNLATLAVFSGALGLGIGLGLQRIVANFIAGFTLLADKSIKPLDVIEIDGKFGWVTSMQARYVALRTRDGMELLVPNERFMTEGVVNWSRSDEVVRMHAPFGVSYRTKDLRLVQALAREAASAAKRVVEAPAPVCNLIGFGDSSVDFDLRFWIRDPANGIANVRSEVLMGLWERLHEHGIEIPFPQRDLHLRSWPAGMGPRDPDAGPTLRAAGDGKEAAAAP